MHPVTSGRNLKIILPYFFVLIKLKSNYHFQLLQNIPLFEDVLYSSFNSYIFSFHSLDDSELLKLENLWNFLSFLLCC